MHSAVGILQYEPDFIAMLLISSSMRRIEAFVAVDDDSDTFLTAPDFTGWANTGVLRPLRTRGLTADQKFNLRTAFIETQIEAIRASHFPFEFATNKSLADKMLFTLFGKGWGPGWKAIAHDAETRIAPSDNPAFQYLLTRHASVDTARLGVLFLAHRHGLDQLTQAEREANYMDDFLHGAGAKPYTGGRF
jgi:hypothetical protein